jgi:ADP-ribose pyrophosphatase
MPDSPRLPSPPRIAVSVTRDRTLESRATGGFVNVRRVDVVTRYADGSVSEPFSYDVVERRSIDAVAIVAYSGRPGAHAEVYLRSAARVPILLRDGFDLEAGNMWEIPAGMIEPDEDPRAGAARELEEELGFTVQPAALESLGAWVWPVPGAIAERHFYFCVDVGALPRRTPTEDGSPLERHAAIVKLPVSEILSFCRDGQIRDAKTELALRRFAERA